MAQLPKELVQHNISYRLYDFISEKMPYGGQKSVIPDQLFSHVYKIFTGNTAQGSTKMFAVDAHGRQISIRAYDISPP